MNRIIKFRAWHTDDEEMYPVLSVNYEDGTCEVEGDDLGLTWRDEVRNVPECILMQFTGLHDKNGKEIYEGDIIHCEDAMATVDMIFRSHEQKVITFEDGAFRYDGITLGDMTDRNGEENYTFEVIGNIYEHERLLTS